jgi:hypothetical protein
MTTAFVPIGKHTQGKFMISGRIQKVRVLCFVATVSIISALFVIAWLRHNQSSEIDPYDSRRIVKEIMFEGNRHVLTDDGNVFRVVAESSRWTWVDKVFDALEIQRDYQLEQGIQYRVDSDTGNRFATVQEINEGFEALPDHENGLRGLIGIERKWSEFTLQSSRAPEVSDYVALRTRILKGDGRFLDARVEPSSEEAHSGLTSLRCFCPAKTQGMICSKASLGSGLVYFVASDDLWYEAWYLVRSDSFPFTLVDFEVSHVKSSPGIRLMLFGEGEVEVGMELKSIEKRTYRQPEHSRVAFPKNRWVKITCHIRLDDENGIVQVSQDDQIVVEATGPTLPFSKAIVNSLEVGISAHTRDDQPSLLFVDDLRLSNRPFTNAAPKP